MLVKFLTRSTVVELFKKLHTSRQVSTSSNYCAQVTFKLSDIGEGIRDVIVKEWYVNVGDKVAQFDNICEVQSDKASVTITSRYDGKILKKYCGIDETLLVGQPLVDIDAEDEGIKEEQSTGEPLVDIEKSQNLDQQSTQEEVTKEPIAFQVKNDPTSNLYGPSCIPSVRRLAKEHRLDLSQIQGSGKKNRILKEDVLKYLQKNDQVQDVKTPLKGFQKAMLKTMTDSLKIPHFVFSEEIKVTRLSSLQIHLLKSQNLKLTLMPFFIKAVSNALQRYPILNSVLTEDLEHVIFKKDINIAVAMDTALGLAVPVIKNADKLTIIQINEELQRLKASGKQGKFRPEDLTGGTFSLSNIGVIGGTYTKPVILPPQLAIIAMGAVQKVPRFGDDGILVKEDIVNVSAAADHRIIDGATMARFIQVVKKQIEDPNLLFLDL